MTTLDTARCALTELPAGQCACKRCRPDLAKFAPTPTLDPFDDPAGPAPSPWFEARYAGRCAVCGDDFDSGTRIQRYGVGFIAECCEVPW